MGEAKAAKAEKLEDDLRKESNGSHRHQISCV